MRFDDEILAAIHSQALSGPERYEAAVVAFARYWKEHGKRMTARLNALARRANVDPDENLQELHKRALEGLRRQCLENASFNENWTVEAWLIALEGALPGAGGPTNYGVLMTLLNRKRRELARPNDVEALDNIPAEEDAVVPGNARHVEELLGVLDPETRCVVGLNFGLMGGPVCGVTIAAYARSVGMTKGVSALYHRASAMQWKASDDRGISQAKLAILFDISTEAIGKMMSAALRQMKTAEECPRTAA